MSHDINVELLLELPVVYRSPTGKDF